MQPHPYPHNPPLNQQQSTTGPAWAPGPSARWPWLGPSPARAAGLVPGCLVAAARPQSPPGPSGVDGLVVRPGVRSGWAASRLWYRWLQGPLRQNKVFCRVGQQRRQNDCFVGCAGCGPRPPSVPGRAPLGPLVGLPVRVGGPALGPLVGPGPCLVVVGRSAAASRGGRARPRSGLGGALHLARPGPCPLWPG